MEVDGYLRAAFANGWAEIEDADPKDAVGMYTAIIRQARDERGPEILELVRGSARYEAIHAATLKSRAKLQKRWEKRFRPILRQAIDVAKPDIARILADKTHPMTRKMIAAQVEQALMDVFRHGPLRPLWGGAIQQAYDEARRAGVKMAHNYLKVAREVAPSTTTVDSSIWAQQQAHAVGYFYSSDLVDPTNDDDPEAISSDMENDQDLTLALVTVGLMLATGWGDGSVEVYAAENIEMMDWLVSDPCPECEDIAADFPKPLADVTEDPPVHPNCQCSLAPYI